MRASFIVDLRDDAILQDVLPRATARGNAGSQSAKLASSYAPYHSQQSCVAARMYVAATAACNR